MDFNNTSGFGNETTQKTEQHTERTKKSIQQVLWWLIGGTRGGENRVRIIRALEEQPQNTNQLANRLDLNYKAVEHHIELLEENGILLSNGAEYGTVYFLTERMEQHLDTLEEIVSQTALNVEYE